MTQHTICSLNDHFRTNLPTGGGVSGKVILTQGIQALCDTDAIPNQHLPELIKTVREFDQFTADNDPYGEHDLGTFEFQGERVFWKIDVMDPSLEVAPLDPTDPELSVRVLTIMLASEY